jgi:hypothetical protein
LILYWSPKNETHLWRQGRWFLVHVPSYLHVKLFVYNVYDLCLIESFHFVIYSLFFPLMTLNWNLIIQKYLYVDDNELVHNVFMVVLTFSYVIKLPSCGKFIIVGKCNNNDCGIYPQYFHKFFYNYNPFSSHVFDLTFNIVYKFKHCCILVNTSKAFNKLMWFCWCVCVCCSKIHWHFNFPR